MTESKKEIINAFWNYSDPMIKSQLKQESIDELYKLLSEKTDWKLEQNSTQVNKKTRLANLLQQLLGLNFEESFDKKEHRTHALKEVIATLHLKPKELAHTSQTLNALIKYGNYHNVWDIGYLPKISIIHHQQNPYTKRNLTLAKKFDLLHIAYEKDLFDENNAQLGLTIFNHEFGKLAFSLIHDSFILRKDDLMFCLESLIERKNIIVLNSRIFIVLESTLGMQQHFPISPITQKIYQQLPSNEHYPLSKKWGFEEIKHYFGASEFSANSLDHLFKQVSCFFHTRLPPILLDILKRKTPNFSVMPKVFDRIFSGYRSTASNRKNFQNLTGNSSNYFLESPEWLDVVQKIHDDKFEELTMLAEDSHTNKNTALFIAYLLRNDAAKQNLQNFSVLHPLLTYFCNGTFIEALDSFERSDLYFEIFEEATHLKHQTNILNELKSFELWHTKTSSLAVIDDWDEIFESKNYEQFVNARMINEDEFLNCVTQLEAKRDNHFKNTFNWSEATLIFLTLGYRLGLRISEIARLKAKDFIFCETAPQILIRKSANRTLKTLNAKRALRLNDFMPSEEVSILLHFYEKNHLNDNKAHDENRYFFSTSKEFTTSINHSKIVGHLLQLVRQVTKDQDLKFHSLRHSFATWNFLSEAQTAFNLNVVHYFENNPATEKWLLGHRARSEKRIGHSDPSNKHFYWLASVIGHASIQTTLHHYIHLVPFVLAEYQLKYQFMGYRKELDQMANFFQISIDQAKKNSSQIHKRISACLKPYQNGYLKINELPLIEFDNKHDQEVIDLNSYEFYQNFLSYQKHIQNGNESIPDSETLDIWVTYEENLKLNFPFKNTVTEEEIKAVLDDIIKSYGQDAFEFGSINSESDAGKTFIADMELFFDRLVFENRKDKSKEEAYLLLSSKSIEICKVLNLTRKLKYNFKAKVGINSKRKNNEIKQIKNYWAKFLEIKSDEISVKNSGNYYLGPHDRIELKIVDDNGRFHVNFR